MNNLVSLKKRSDPDPGECRSMQICTLPITIKGMPKNALECEKWHDGDCAGTVGVTCVCKQDKVLNSKDIDNLLIHLTTEQASSFDNFQKLMTFGYNTIWNAVFEGLDTIQLERSMCDDQDDNDAVNSTFDDSLILRVHSDNEDDTDTRCLANEDKSTMVTETTVSRQEDRIRKENKMLLKLDFQQHKPLPLLSRHPPPAIGRDDDNQKLKEILDDVLIKTDSTKDTSHKILFAPDHKIAVNLMKLRETNKRCGTYYKNMKQSLFSTPNKWSDINFALDTQREMDHKDALKAFRSGSTVAFVVPRMSPLDVLDDVRDVQTSSIKKERTQAALLGFEASNTDERYVCRIMSLILRQGGISLVEDENIYNVYDHSTTMLSPSILDKNTKPIGQYLIKMYAAQEGLCNASRTDIPDISDVEGPKLLLPKVKSTKVVTIKRMSAKLANETKQNGKKMKNLERRQ
ncbi:hypothetical protein MAR_028811 [Mya arenaria]|uniref:Uncharacterized protein n=1 Tax=Mya arenaria TaxID=6604 RepID=A0ABY7DEM5_MYAAR|nr:hypothetical protein MAR_028811 [Mya arenaria]